MKKILIATCVALIFSNIAWSLELKFYPGDRLFLNPAEPNRGTADVIAHLLVIKNNSNEAITLNNVDLQLKNDSVPFEFVNLKRRPELGHFARIKKE